MRIPIAIACLVLTVAATCPGLPDSDGDGIPDAIDPCPANPDPACVPPVTPPEAYDCDNPPAVAGFVAVAHPVKDRFIVVLKERHEFASRLLSVAEGFKGVQKAQSLVSLSAFVATIADRSALAKIVADPRVAYVQQEGLKSIRVTWNLDRIDQRDLPRDNTYDPGADGFPVNVATIDTGVTDIPDFEGRLSSECFSAIVFGGCTDGHGHGTFVTGTIGGKTWGVAKRATLYAVRVLDANGSGTDTDVIRGIDWVTTKKKANPDQLWVANMSLGGDPSPALDQAVCNSIAAGVVHVVAAGNESSDSRGGSPARVVQAVTVGAMDQSDRGASFSNFGPFVDLFAPGVDVESATPQGGSVTMSGTSMASPHVAGAAALYLSRHPASTPAQVAAGLVVAASRDKLSGIGEGSPNRLLYVKEGEAPSPPPENTPPKAEPVGSERLLRPDGTRLRTSDGKSFDAVMTEPCCQAWTMASVGPQRPKAFSIAGVDTPTLWPLASEAWMDHTAAKGAANMFHFRGPFLASEEPEWASIGGAYLPGSLEWNPHYWQKERDLAWHAYQAGGYVEKVVIDTWGCKRSQAGHPYLPWPQDAIDACGRTWYSEHERYARKVVEELGCFGNVIWALDNEGENVVGWKAEWFRKLDEVIRDEEQKSGCGFIHMRGSGVRELQAEVDYAITHDRVPLMAPLAGRWTLNNEHNPAFTPAEEESHFASARALGLAWALWRDDMSDADFEDTLGRFKAIVDGGTPPPEDLVDKPLLSEADCPKPLGPGAVVYLTDAQRYAGGQGLTLTPRVRGDAEFCWAIHGVETSDCHLEGWPTRDRCERWLMGGCPTWRYATASAGGASGVCSDDRATAPISCDHFGDPTFRDDPQTPGVFEGRPKACGLQRDEFGPKAGYFVIPHCGAGECWIQACMPDGAGCSALIRATWRE